MSMRKAISNLTFGFFLGLAHPALGSIEPGDRDHPVEGSSCRTHLQALVADLKETAILEGRALIVEWRDDMSVLLHCDDFIQRMWCQGEELHVDFDGPLPE